MAEESEKEGDKSLEVQKTLERKELLENVEVQKTPKGTTPAMEEHHAQCSFNPFVSLAQAGDSALHSENIMNFIQSPLYDSSIPQFLANTSDPQPKQPFMPPPAISTQTSSLGSLFKDEDIGGFKHNPPEESTRKHPKEKKDKSPKSRLDSLEKDVNKTKKDMKLSFLVWQ